MLALVVALDLLAAQASAASGDFAALCADRTLVEHVYYDHRLGDKPPFEELLPPAAIQKLIRQDLLKEAVLKKVYGVEINPTQVEMEVRRINTSTRDPQTLAELKSALGGDPARFGQTVVKPILVERELRERFENDDPLHAPQRQEIEAVRAQLLDGKNRGQSITGLCDLLLRDHTNEVSETVWQLGARPMETNASGIDPVEIQKRFGPKAQILSSPEFPGAPKFYFSDLPGPLQQVLRTQLRQAGDISAVIEVPSGFLLYLCRKKDAQTLDACLLTVPKRGYEAWIAGQSSANE
jgi:hypothetical protein